MQIPTRLASAVTILTLSLALLACGSDSSDDSVPSPAGPSPSAAAGAGSPAPTGTRGPDPTGALPKPKLQRAFGELGFARMTGMYTAPDGKGRIFVTEQVGRIMVFDGRAANPQAAVYLDIRDRVDANSSEMGLLGLAFAPDFRDSGAFYVNYTATSGGNRRTVVARFLENSAGRTASAASSETILLEIDQPFTNHNGGQIAFGPDKMLYIGMGDGGSGGDPQGHGQNRRSLLGKMLRIDPSGSNGDLKYRVPQDNPFVGQSAGARTEIWAYGLRNPWRFSFDSETGALWLADVGQGAREEIDVIVKGGNYGWNVMEGNQCFSSQNCNRDGLILPVFDYGREGGCSVTGGFVYRGQAIASLRGAYVYGDYCSGKIWGLRYDGTKATDHAELIDSSFMISSFAVDEAGEIYALQYGNSGGIFKLVP